MQPFIIMHGVHELRMLICTSITLHVSDTCICLPGGAVADAIDDVSMRRVQEATIRAEFCMFSAHDATLGFVVRAPLLYAATSGTSHMRYRRLHELYFCNCL